MSNPTIGHYASHGSGGLTEPLVVTAPANAISNKDTLLRRLEAAMELIVELTAERDLLQAARYSYASLFPPNADGEPDVDSIHQNIRGLIAERDQLRDVLWRGGFVMCDIPACNCGSWHHKYGLPERFREIADVLAEAGHELCNENGNLPIRALKSLAAERDRLRAELAECRRDADRFKTLDALCVQSANACGRIWRIDLPAATFDFLLDIDAALAADGEAK